jgi:hypothetical protein
MAALLRHQNGKADSGVRSCVGRASIAVGQNFLVAEFGEVLAEISMGRETIVAAICLRDRQRDPVAGFEVERAFAERAVQTKEAFQPGGTDADQPEQVRYTPELFVDGIQKRLRGTGRSCNGRRNRDQDMGSSFGRLGERETRP